MLKKECLEPPLGEECKKIVKGCWPLGVTKAETTKQGCKISQTKANGNSVKVGGRKGAWGKPNNVIRAEYLLNSPVPNQQSSGRTINWWWDHAEYQTCFCSQCWSKTRIVRHFLVEGISFYKRPVWHCFNGFVVLLLGFFFPDQMSTFVGLVPIPWDCVSVLSGSAVSYSYVASAILALPFRTLLC